MGLLSNVIYGYCILIIIILIVYIGLVYKKDDEYSRYGIACAAFGLISTSMAALLTFYIQHKNLDKLESIIAQQTRRIDELQKGEFQQYAIGQLYRNKLKEIGKVDSALSAPPPDNALSREIEPNTSINPPKSEYRTLPGLSKHVITPPPLLSEINRQNNINQSQVDINLPPRISTAADNVRPRRLDTGRPANVNESDNVEEMDRIHIDGGIY